MSPLGWQAAHPVHEDAHLDLVDRMENLRERSAEGHVAPTRMDVADEASLADAVDRCGGSHLPCRTLGVGEVVRLQRPSDAPHGDLHRPFGVAMRRFWIDDVFVVACRARDAGIAMLLVTCKCLGNFLAQLGRRLRRVCICVEPKCQNRAPLLNRSRVPRRVSALRGVPIVVVPRGERALVPAPA